MNILDIIPVMLFAFSMSVTPGPNNVMLTASGATFGFKKTIPHIVGIIVGIALLNMLCALGLSQLFKIFPQIQTILKYIGFGYMIFLAWKIVVSNSTKDGKVVSAPLTLIQALIFQILNPKAVVMCITAMSLYTIQGDMFIFSVLMIITVFIIIGFPSITIWAALGTIIGKQLKNRVIHKIFNYTMATITAIAAFALLR